MGLRAFITAAQYKYDLCTGLAEIHSIAGAKIYPEFFDSLADACMIAPGRQSSEVLTRLDPGCSLIWSALPAAPQVVLRPMPANAQSAGRPPSLALFSGGESWQPADGSITGRPRPPLHRV